PCSSARPTVSAAMRFRLATHQPNTAAPSDSVMIALMKYSTYCNTRDVLSRCRGQSPVFGRTRILSGSGWVGAARGETAPRTKRGRSPFSGECDPKKEDDPFD